MPWSTDYDWTSADTLRNNPREIILQLVPALNERRENANTSLSYPAIVVERGEPMATVQLLDYANKIDQVMENSFFSSFADQTDGVGGDFSGGNIPHWDQLRLNAAIGLDRPDFNPGDVVSAEWVWWMYSALNLLIWTDNETSGRVSNRSRTVTGQPSFSAAVTAWNAEPWGAWSGYGATSSPARHSGSQSSISRRASRLDAISPPSSTYYKADIYVRFSRRSITVYENNDYTGVGENTLGRVHEDSTRRTGDFPQGLAEVGNFDVVTVTEPVSGSRGWATEESFDTADWRIIRKFDVTGGFDYVAP